MPQEKKKIMPQKIRKIDAPRKVKHDVTGEKKIKVVKEKKVDDDPFVKKKKNEHLSNHYTSLFSGALSFLEESTKVVLVKPLHEKVLFKDELF